MATPLDSPLTFTNVGKAKWWRSGFFASQIILTARSIS